MPLPANLQKTILPREEDLWDWTLGCLALPPFREKFQHLAEFLLRNQLVAWNPKLALDFVVDDRIRAGFFGTCFLQQIAECADRIQILTGLQMGN